MMGYSATSMIQPLSRPPWPLLERPGRGWDNRSEWLTLQPENARAILRRAWGRSLWNNAAVSMSPLLFCFRHGNRTIRRHVRFMALCGRNAPHLAPRPPVNFNFISIVLQTVIFLMSKLPSSDIFVNWSWSTHYM